jgi:hypothetical protein
VHVAVIVIERQRDLQLRGRLLEEGIAIVAPIIKAPRSVSLSFLDNAALQLQGLVRQLRAFRYKIADDLFRVAFSSSTVSFRSLPDRVLPAFVPSNKR